MFFFFFLMWQKLASKVKKHMTQSLFDMGVSRLLKTERETLYVCPFNGARIETVICNLLIEKLSKLKHLLYVLDLKGLKFHRCFEKKMIYCIFTY